MQILRIGLLGLGNIGRGVYSLIKNKKKLISERDGIRLEVVRIGDRGKSVELPEQKRLLTQNIRSILRDSKIDVIVELIGGVHPAFEFVLEAFKNGKDVVTANKALLAEKGNEIFRAAEKYGRQIYFEASVGGGIPVIAGIRENLIANKIQSIHSIINGTSNYILSQMTAEKLDFKTALKQAQKLGFAEANPKLDIDGTDAAHKIAVLASLAFGRMVKFENVYVEGIEQIRSEDIAFADEFGYRIKLLAIAKAAQDGIEARVQPTLLPKNHFLSSVNGSFNAILVHGDEVGDMLFHGRGAGRKPTASAVVSDLVKLAKVRSGVEESCVRFPKGWTRVKNISSILSRYYLRFHVVDRPGVLADISRVLQKYQISISDVIQKEQRTGSVVPLILLTHNAREDKLRQAVQKIDRLSSIRGKTQVLRIES